MPNLKNAAVLCLVSFAIPAQAEETSAINQAIIAYNDSFNSTGSEKTKRLVQAALGFYEIEENGGADEAKFKAEYYLAQALYELGLSYSASHYYMQIIDAGAAHPYFAKAVEGAVKVAEAMHDETFVPAFLNKRYNKKFYLVPADALAKVHFIMGRVDYRANHFKEGTGFLSAVPKTSSYYALARYLLGLSYIPRPEQKWAGDPDKALKMFDEVRELQSTDQVVYADLEQVQDLSQVGLARVYYATGKGQFGSDGYQKSASLYHAIPKYDRAWHPGEPERYSPHWEEALFEGAWADFMNDDPGGALGKLQTLHSPALSDSFQPESWVLESIIYFQNCLYDQTRVALDQYDKIYLPMSEAIKPLIEESKDDEFYFNLVHEAQEGKNGLPTSIRLFLEKNEQYKSYLNYAGQLDGELGIINSTEGLRSAQMAKDLAEMIGRRRGLLVQSAGKFIKGRLANVAATLTGFEGQAEIVRLETSSSEKDLLERNDDPASRLGKQELLRPDVPDETYEYWAFQGEWWPDELGYYKYTLKNACPVETNTASGP